MNKEKSELDQFLGDIPNDNTAKIDPHVEVPEVKENKTPEQEASQGEEPRKNRQHRRLEEQLRKEREANILLAERLKVASEAQRFSQETGGEVDPRLARAFGTTEEGKEVSKLFAEVLKETTKKAKEEALREIEERQAKLIDQQKQFESVIDSELESIEDQFNVDLTSNSPAAKKTRSEFLEIVQKLSPKDEDGSITSYADFGSAFELYQNSKAKDNPSTTRQKEIASRSMQSSSSITTGEKDQMDAEEKWLNQAGIRTRNK